MNIKRTEVKKGESFFVTGEKYVIMANRALPYAEAHSPVIRRSDPRYWLKRKPRSPESKFPLKDAGYACYYQLDENLYVLLRYERYPCFDEFDYEYDKRFYNQHFFCSSLEEVKQKHAYLCLNHIRVDSGKISEKHLVCLSPFVYIDDGKETFTVCELDL